MKKQLLVAVALAALAAGSAMAQANDTLAKVKASGVITQGVRDSSGALAYAVGDQYMGFHYDVCTQIIRDVRKQLGMSQLETKYQLVTSTNRIPLVQNGTVDLECGSTTNNEAREKDVAFANTLYVEEVRIAVKANSPIKSITDLNGKTVATTAGTTSVQLIRQNKRAKGIDFTELSGKDHADSFLLLSSGRADAFVMDGQILAGNISKSPNPKDFKLLPDVLSIEPIAIMIRKDDPAFLKAVNDSIEGQVKRGEIAKLYDKWFMQPIPPTNTKVGLPASPATKDAWAHLNAKPKEAYPQ